MRFYFIVSILIATVAYSESQYAFKSTPNDGSLKRLKINKNVFCMKKARILKSGKVKIRYKPGKLVGKFGKTRFVSLKPSQNRAKFKKLCRRKANRWANIRATDVAKIADEWQAPVYLQVNDSGWEDSVAISADGNTLYFMWYPRDLIKDEETGNFLTDIDTHFSNAPFVKRSPLKKFFLTEDIASAAGMMITPEGDIFYHSNHEGLTTGKFDDDIYRNDQRLPFNTDENWTNPHYCSGKDELWFDKNDTKIFVLKNAAASGFNGIPQVAPAPINNGNPDVPDFQPWLSSNCRTIYFSSGRGGFGPGPAIFRSFRLADDSWSEPEIIVSSTWGVGEPALTTSGNLYFLQLFKNKKGVFTSDIFFAKHR